MLASMEPGAIVTVDSVPRIDVQSFQRLTQIGDRFEFRFTEADAYRFAKLGQYPQDPGAFGSDPRYLLFNIRGELFNPHFSARFWDDCLRIGGGLPASYLKSLAQDLISVQSDAVRIPVRHLVSSWRFRDRIRVAGPQFVSDVSFLFAANASQEQKALLVRQTIAGMLPRHYDMLAIGFELPDGMQEVAASIARRAPHPPAAHFRVFRANAEENARLTSGSMTARLLLSAPGCESDCFILDIDGLAQEPVRFAVFVLFAPDGRQCLDSSEFWTCAVTPLVADTLRIYEHMRVPGQKSRTFERRKVAVAASQAAFIPDAPA